MQWNESLQSEKVVIFYHFSDIALESDEQLFKKLIELAKSNHEIASMTHNMNIDKFVPMAGSGSNSLFYRTERGDTGVNGNIKDFNKERIEYQS